MTVHIIKLFVGLDTLPDLAAWQTQRLEDMKRNNRTPELVHVTRNTPRRADEVLDGGSLYWVIKGWISARQKLLELRPMMRDGAAHCGLVYHTDLITVQPRPRRAFQGWRYFDPKDAPPDIGKWSAVTDLPDGLRRELTFLGLL